MMKFFRKHNKELLAVFMAMLMVVFIGGSALQGMLTPSQNRVVATSTLGDINYRDQQEATAVTEVLERLGESWRTPLGGGQPLEIIDWILLAREANKIGTEVGVAAVRSMLTPQQVDAMSRQLNVKPAVVIHAFREMRSIQQTALTVGAGAAPSEADIQSAARDVLEKVKINALVLPAKAFVDDSWTFTDAEIQTQFEAYRDKEAGGGLNFGYYRHPAIKVQFIQIDRGKIAGELAIPNLEKRAHKYYDENRERDRAFRRPPDQMVAAPDGPKPDPYLSWEEASDAAELAVRNQQAESVAERIAGWLISAAGEPWITADRGDDGYRKVPESATSLDAYRGLIDKLPPSISYPDAVFEWRSNFFTRETAGDVAMIGPTFFLPERGTPRPFSDLAFKNKFMVPNISDNEQANSAEFVAPFQTYPYSVKNRQTGEVFVFRVIEGREGHPADSLDEVRDAVVADLRLKKAYEMAQSRAKGLAACDPETSLRDLYESDPDLVALNDAPDRDGAGYYSPEPFGRTPEYLAAQGRPPDGVRAPGGVGLLSNDIVEKLFGLEYTMDHRGVYELPDRASILVAEWVKTERPDDESYMALHKPLSDQITQGRFAGVLTAWLSPDQIRARNKFTLVE